MWHTVDNCRKYCKMGSAKAVQHEIKLERNKPIRSRFYSVGKNKEEMPETKVKEVLGHNPVEPLKSEYASLGLLVNRENEEHGALIEKCLRNQSQT